MMFTHYDIILKYSLPQLHREKSLYNYEILHLNNFFFCKTYFMIACVGSMKFTLK